MEFCRIRVFIITSSRYKIYTNLRENIAKIILSAAMLYMESENYILLVRYLSYGRANLHICMVQVEPSQGD